MRKTEVVQVPDEWGGRDAGKYFLITEWPAAKAEHWAIKCLIAYNRGGGQVPMDAIGGGMEAIFLLGVNTFLRGQMQASEVIPILDELLECVKIIRDHKVRSPTGEIIATEILTTATIEDIAEPKTRLWLRSEVIRIHTNFSPADMLWNLISAVTKLEPLPTARKRRTSPP